jgi:hypothetical protein
LVNNLEAVYQQVWNQPHVVSSNSSISEPAYYNNVCRRHRHHHHFIIVEGEINRPLWKGRDLSGEGEAVVGIEDFSLIREVGHATRREKLAYVPAHPSTNPVEQPIDLFFNRPAHTTLLRVGIEAWPIGPLASSLFNRSQGENYACSVAK